jgi:hypothetical protein
MSISVVPAIKYRTSTISSLISCILTLFFAIFPFPHINIHFEAWFGNFYAFILRPELPACEFPTVSGILL